MQRYLGASILSNVIAPLALHFGHRGYSPNDWQVSAHIVLLRPKKAFEFRAVRRLVFAAFLRRTWFSWAPSRSIAAIKAGGSNGILLMVPSVSSRMLMRTCRHSPGPAVVGSESSSSTSTV